MTVHCECIHARMLIGSVWKCRALSLNAPMQVEARLLLQDPGGGERGLFGALTSPGLSTHPPTSEKFSSKGPEI